MEEPRYDAQGRRLCTAHLADRSRLCRAPALTGTTVCIKHGGQLPNVREKAHRVVLEELVGPAIVVLRSLMLDGETPAAVRAAIARDLLDRGGFKPAERLEVLTLGQIEAEIAKLEAELADE